MSRPSIYDRLAAAQARSAKAQLTRRLRCVDRADGPHLQINGRLLLSFCSNDYLGLANHPAIVAALKSAAEQDGVGSMAAHLICGHRREHAALEEDLAEWMGRKRVLVFSTGYMANLSVLTVLLQAGDLCVQDKLNHASLLDGAHLAGVELKRYRHADLDSAARQLASRPGVCALLATEGVFSMDGDAAPLPALASLCKKERSVFMVDVAHGLGVTGPQGAGSVAAANLGEEDVPVLMATFGKALGTFGAFVAGGETLIDALTQSARPYIYTTAMPPALAAATRAAIAIARKETWRREKLAALVARYRAGAEQLGLPLTPSTTAIQPLMLGDAGSAVDAARQLEKSGFLVGAIRPPTVPYGSARLRVTFSASHEESEVDRLLEALSEMRLPTARNSPQAPDGV